MTDRELMQQVLDALECATPPTFSAKLVEDWEKAIEALRARLAQPEREWHGLTDKAYEAIAERYVTNGYFDRLKFARAIESKLRRKNT